MCENLLTLVIIREQLSALEALRNVALTYLLTCRSFSIFTLANDETQSCKSVQRIMSRFRMRCTTEASAQ